MTWIKTIPFDEADEKLRRAMEAQRGLYPAEYAEPVQPTARRQASWRRIASSLTLSTTPSRPPAY